MRKLISSLFAFLLMISSLAGVAAQNADSAYSDGIGDSATWFNDRGEPVATLEVTDLINDWSEFDDNRAARGYLFHGVVINVTNLGLEEIEVSSRDFSMTDSLGLDTSRSNVRAVEDATMPVFSDSVMVAGGESIELLLVFELFSDVEPAMLTWDAERGQVVLINLGDGTLETSSIVHGINTPASTSDERGNEISTFQVTGITDDWDEYDPNREPERGMRYVAVDVSISNVSDDELPIPVNSLALIDNEGAVNTSSNTQAAEDAETVVMTSNEEVAPGETLETTLVFQLYAEVDPVGMMWQPQNGMKNFVVLEEDTGTDTEGDDVAEPDAGDEVIEATPAA